MASASGREPISMLLEQLQDRLQEAEAVKSQFYEICRHLVLTGRVQFDNNDEEVQPANVWTHKRQNNGDISTVPKKKSRSGKMTKNERMQMIQLDIHPKLRPIFEDLKQRYAEVEDAAMKQDYREIKDFIQQLAFSSKIVVQHIPAIVDVTLAAKPHTTIVALAGYKSEVWCKNDQQNGRKMTSITASLVATHNAPHTFPAPSDPSAPAVPTLPVYYTSEPDGKPESAPALPLRMVTGSDRVLAAVFYNIAPQKQKGDDPWVDGYHMMFQAAVPDGQHHYVAVTLPFEIVSNYSKQKSQKWGHNFWRLAFCSRNANCTAVALQSEQIRVTAEKLLELASYWFKAYVETWKGLNSGQKMALRRLLSEADWGCHIGYLIYGAFEKTFWPLFFTAADLIQKPGIKKLWELGFSAEAEALLWEKNEKALLIRHQQNPESRGLFCISVFVPAEDGKPAYLAHVPVGNPKQKLKRGEKQKESTDPKQDLLQVAAFTKLYLGAQSKEGIRFKEFKVFGYGDYNIGQYAPSAFLGRLGKYVGKLIEYKVEMDQVSGKLRERVLKNAVELEESELGRTLRYHNQQSRALEWLPDEIGLIGYCVSDVAQIGIQAHNRNQAALAEMGIQYLDPDELDDGDQEIHEAFGGDAQWDQPQAAALAGTAQCDQDYPGDHSNSAVAYGPCEMSPAMPQINQGYQQVPSPRVAGVQAGQYYPMVSPASSPQQLVFTNQPQSPGLCQDVATAQSRTIAWVAQQSQCGATSSDPYPMWQGQSPRPPQSPQQWPFTYQSQSPGLGQNVTSAHRTMNWVAQQNQYGAASPQPPPMAYHPCAYANRRYLTSPVPMVPQGNATLPSIQTFSQPLYSTTGQFSQYGQLPAFGGVGCMPQQQVPLPQNFFYQQPAMITSNGAAMVHPYSPQGQQCYRQGTNGLNSPNDLGSTISNEISCDSGTGDDVGEVRRLGLDKSPKPSLQEICNGTARAQNEMEEYFYDMIRKLAISKQSMRPDSSENPSQ